MVKYTSPILPHVHLRGKEYPEHNYLQLGFRDAKAVGAIAVLEQPNPTPNLIKEEPIRERIKQSEQYSGDIYHGIHIGLTNDLIQVEQAFTLAKERTSSIVGVKAFWVDSTGNMGIWNEEKQKEIWAIAARKVKFTGVFFQHCQNEYFFRGDYLKDSPLTHSLVQTKWSEIYSLMQQVRNARDANFRGIFYAAHVSTPEGIEFLCEEKQRNHPFQIVIETTAHHEMLNTRDYLIHSNRVKMNPALRERKDQEKVLEYVIEEKTDIAGDDHAPHPVENKDNPLPGIFPPSGIPAIVFLPKRVEIWRSLGMSENNIEKLLFTTANRIFQLGLNPHPVEFQYKPELWQDYGYNPFSRVDKSTSQ
ncbi:MAG: hypothetical protein AABY00_02100 [Nanoarchaeota archaeon]